MAASNRHTQKIHGKHQKHTRDFLKVYTPYLPLMMIVIVGLVLSVMSPPKTNKNVLAYATSMTVDQLLTATNQDRISHHLPTLKLNSKLNSAAQSKANDMVNRNYWSHTTPDGQQPWVFISKAGYKYQAAAENLAYGFDDGSSTVQGWMNSSEHRANMLNSSYIDVGFGFKNSSNFVGSGQETVVVAEYGKPITTSVTAAPISQPKSTPSAPTQVKATETTIPPTTDKTTSSASAAATTNKASSPTATATVPAAKTAATIEPASQSVSRLSSIINANFAWVSSAALLITVVGLGAIFTRHALAFSKWVRQGERYVMHHFVFDLTIISLLGLSIIATQSVGFIK